MRNAKFILFFIPLIVFVSCAPQNSKIVVAEYGNYKIYMDDFEKAYARNPGEAGKFVKTKTDSLESLKKFLDLFVTYKMKLRNAEVRGYTTDADMQKELRDYKINIGTTLFLEDALYEPNIRQLYERRKTELRASHIFLTPDSTMNEKEIVEFGNQLIQRIQKGEDFAALAKQYSKDTYTKDKGGDVYFFTAGQINSPQLEDAVYNTEPGKIYPQLVNSGFGYHIIKLTDKRTRRPSIRAEHILIRFSDSTGTDTAKALKEIQEIEQKIKNGADFGEMALKYSQDKGSALQRGDLGFFGRSRMVKEFDETAFNLKKGEISPVVKTQFGFHLIRLVDESTYPTYQEEKDELRDIYRRVRYKSDFEKLVEKLKTEFNYQQNKETFNIILSKSDTVKIGPGYWTSKIKKETGEEEIFNINNKSFPVDSLFSFLIKKGLFFNRTLDSKILYDGINQYAGDLLVREKAL
ncbi:MAG: peptidylprolyl isomerase, partial [Bacteroidota bacterium]